MPATSANNDAAEASAESILLHHVNFDCLHAAFFNLKKTAAVGVDEATACLEALHTRFAKFGLKLHKDKTRLIEFGKYAIERRERHDEGRPETFNFLGFTHKRAQTKKHGWFTIHRHSIAKRVRATRLLFPFARHIC